MSFIGVIYKSVGLGLLIGTDMTQKQLYSKLTFWLYTNTMNLEYSAKFAGRPTD